MFGFKLNEKIGTWSFAFWVLGFYVAFMPLYVLGLNGMMRRTSHYANLTYHPYLIAAAIGAGFILVGIVLQFWQLIYSIRHRQSLRDMTGDPWNGRTLEWSISSPPPLYNFAFTPTVKSLDAFWVEKQTHPEEVYKPKAHYQAIHLPKNTATGFIIALFSGILGFALIWHMWIPGIIGLVGVLATAIAKTFDLDTEYYLDADIVKKTELAHLKEVANHAH